MLLAPLIIVVAGIARVTSRIVRGVGQEKRAGDHRERTPPRKIRARFRGYKHILLIFVVLAFYELRLCGVLRSSAIIQNQGVGKSPARVRPFAPYAAACISERVSAHETS